MDRGPCTYCNAAPITGRRRKYCDPHSRQASAIWKREHRRRWKAEGRRYWREDARSDEERRGYFRTYMRAWRQRRRTNPSLGGETE
jgi:hypothetical protein